VNTQPGGLYHRYCYELPWSRRPSRTIGAKHHPMEQSDSGFGAWKNDAVYYFATPFLCRSIGISTSRMSSSISNPTLCIPTIGPTGRQIRTRPR
jgi:hypothetical protein